MKIKKAIMLMLIFVFSLSLFSVVRAEEKLKVSKEEVLNEGNEQTRKIEVIIPKSYVVNDNTEPKIEEIEVDPQEVKIMFENTKKVIRFYAELYNGDPAYFYNIEEYDIAENGDVIVTLSWIQDQTTLITKLTAMEGTNNGVSLYLPEITYGETVLDYEVGSGTPDNSVPLPEPEPDDSSGGPPKDNNPGGFYNPYKIKVSTLREVVEIKYDKVPFYFYVDSESAEGTFLVDFDEKNKVVKFDYISDQKRVGYVKEHENDTPYSQVGAESVNLVEVYGITTETTPEYIVKEYHQIGGGIQNIKCAFNYLDTVLSTGVSHPASYVFVRRTIKNSVTGDLERYVLYEFCGYDESEEPAGFLETLCTKVLAFLGDLFMMLIKAFLGQDLTIDRIIFNEYEPVVIDLEGGRGILGSASVRTMIQNIYNMFVAIAVVVYVTILLYIGVKVLFGVATPRQGEYRKDLTNWVVGLVLLFVVPQFFRYIPSIINSVLDYIGKEGRMTMYSYYNLDDMLDEMDSEKVGVSGEDNRSTYIERLKGLREQKEGEKAEVEENIKIKSDSLRSLCIYCYKSYLQYILEPDDMPDSEEIEQTADAAVERMVNYMRNNLEEFIEYDSEKKKPILNDDGDVIHKRLNFNDVEYYQNNVLQLPISQNMRGPFLNRLLNELPQLIYTSGELDEDINMLTSLINGVDLMGNMRVLAGQTGRFTYAVVWWICIYEMIVMLCMYYRRVIVMGILITIYPLVAMTYPIDKLKDGKAQTLTNWYKEFTVNLVVQIVHAIVYIVLVQSGIKLYQANANNWLFFILAVLFLFPAERLMRGIFGLKGTSIKELKANAVGIAGTAATAITLGKQTGRAANEKFGITKKGKEAKANKQKAIDKAKKNRDNRDKYLQGRADQKENLRKQKAEQRRRKAASMSGTRKMAYNAYAKTMNAAGRARSAAYKLGNKGRKLKGQYRKLQDSKFAKYANSAWKVARGATGLAVGAANFVTTSGTSGLGAGFVSGTATARTVGGFKDRDRLQQAIDNRASSQTANTNANTSQNANAGSGGSNGGGSAPRTTPRINVPPSVGGAPSTNNGSASATTGNVQVNVNTTTNQNVHTQDSNQDGNTN